MLNVSIASLLDLKISASQNDSPLFFGFFFSAGPHKTYTPANRAAAVPLRSTTFLLSRGIILRLKQPGKCQENEENVLFSKRKHHLMASIFYSALWDALGESN